MTTQEVMAEMQASESKIAHIRETYPNNEWPNVSAEPVWYGRQGRERIEGQRTIINKNDGMHYAFVSDLYKIVPHEVLLYDVLDVVSGFPEHGNPDVKITLPSGGGKCRFDISFPNVEYDIGKSNGVHDAINPSVTAFGSYDLAWKQKMFFGAMRIICTNGMSVGDEFSRFIKRHIVSLEPAIMREALKEGMTNFSEQTEIWKGWVGHKMSNALVDETWEALPTTEKEQEAILELVETSTQRPMLDYVKTESVTQWMFHSAVTQWMTHNLASPIKRAEYEPKVARVFHTIH